MRLKGVSESKKKQRYSIPHYLFSKEVAWQSVKLQIYNNIFLRDLLSL